MKLDILFALLSISCAYASVQPKYSESVAQALSYCKRNDRHFVNDLLKLAAIPSIASMPEHKGDMVNAANWIRKRLTKAKLENARLLPTPEHPAVYADWLHATGAPTVLIYGHYDVQPADPFNLWQTPPFKPTIVDDTFYGRGVDDMKGNLVLTVQAVESLLNTVKSLPLNVKFLFEGQEEIGSPHFTELLQDNKELLAADYALSADGGQISPTQPSICLGLRGVIAVEVQLQTLARDVHSGFLGGAVLNPALALGKLLSTFHTDDGKINIQGFYDDVIPMTTADQEDVKAYGADVEQILQETGAISGVGEEGFGLIERTWHRPSLDVVGMESGVTGEGIKTIIPAVASCKVSCRLVPNQDPAKIVGLLKQHIESHAPPAANVSVTVKGFLGAPYSNPKDNPANRAAARVLSRLMGNSPRYERSGGSIGALAAIQKVLGLHTTMFGFGLSGNGAHSPNERFQKHMFDLGREAYINILYELADEYTSAQRQPQGEPQIDAGDKSEL